MRNKHDLGMHIVRVDGALRLWRRIRWQIRVGLQTRVELRNIEPGFDWVQEREETFGVVSVVLDFTGNKFERERSEDIAADLEHGDYHREHDQTAQALHIPV